MFCGECGTKNKTGAKFCEKCGQELKENSSNNVTNVEEKVAKPVPAAPKKPVPKQAIFAIIGCGAFVLLLIVFFSIGAINSKPEKVAEKYMDAYTKQDYSKLYKYQVEVKDGDKTFVSKEAFENIMKESNDTRITNYTLGKIVYGAGKITASVPVKYVTEKSSSESSGTIELKKTSDKTYLVYSKWVLSNSYNDSTVIKDFELKVPKGAKAEYAGVTVDKKYLDSAKSSDSIDVYVLKQVLPVKTKVKATLSNGIIIEESVTPSSYTKSSTVKLSSSNISDDLKKKLVETSKVNLSAIFKGALDKTEFEKLDIKNKDNNFKTEYDKYVNSIHNLSGNKTISKLNIKTVDYSSLSVTSDNYVRLYVKISYDYTITQGENTKDKVGNDYVYLTYDISGKNFVLYDASSLPTYFYYY